MAPANIEAQPATQARDRSPSPSPRSASISLHAAATLNAGLSRGEPATGGPLSSSSPRDRQPSTADRRRSQVLTNLQIANPSMPAPGEMVTSDTPQTAAGVGTTSPTLNASSPRISGSASGSPYHHRAPSLGELHQELENEQEYQVNRLLQEIRLLQGQLQRQQQQSGQSAIVDDPSDTGRSGSLQATASATQPSQPGHPTSSGSLPRSPAFPRHARSSFDMASADIRRRSRTPSRTASPRLRSTSISYENGEPHGFGLGGRDESALYMAETQMLIRENQMLRHRIRDLERQLAETTGGGGGASGYHEPPHSSSLNHSTSVSEIESSRPKPDTSTPLSAPMDIPKKG